ncbi:hypothetical protein FZ041_00075 [Selenomonas caprae]|uniref:Uncharacterized protein n=1 Tax=Selenomonas caprae TaxID=2606905 RepID=A0A5D6WUL0_9FIRM|nr:hypothetical protein [Selenomonas caprae]TYZ30955.1 hypothetical protein FZ041_00075 [Selenomonas caprae]
MDEEKATEDGARRRRRNIAAGAIAAICLLAAGAGIFHSLVRPPGESQQQALAADAGLIDWQKVIEAHPDHARLTKLREECKVLELETSEVEDIFTVKPPEQDPKPLEDSVWAKNALDVVGQRAELERKSKRVAAEYRAQTEAAYQEQIRAIDEEYLNDILNINIKLDNQEAMHNPLDPERQLAEERAIWLQQREQLQQERGRRQYELRQAYEQQVAAHVQQVLGPELAAWRANLPQQQAQQRAAAAATQSEADKRNAETMQKQMELAQQVQQRLAKRQELLAKQAQLQALEAHILNDVAGRAAKIAILHHFTLILVDHPRVLTSFAPDLEQADPLHRTYSRAIGVTTVDVTDELVQEVQTLTPGSDAQVQDTDNTKG